MVDCFFCSFFRSLALSLSFVFLILPFSLSLSFALCLLRLSRHFLLPLAVVASSGRTRHILSRAHVGSPFLSLSDFLSRPAALSSSCLWGSSFPRPKDVTNSMSSFVWFICTFVVQPPAKSNLKISAPPPRPPESMLAKHPNFCFIKSDQH